MTPKNVNTTSIPEPVADPVPELDLPESINKNILSEIKDELGLIFDQNIDDTEFVINQLVSTLV